MSIFDITKRLVGSGSATTTDFASAFQTETGQSPTNEDLIQFTQERERARQTPHPPAGGQVPTSPVSGTTGISAGGTVPVAAPVDVLTSDKGESYVNQIDEMLKQRQDLIKQEQSSLEQARLAREAQIGAEFERRRGILGEQQREEAATSKVLQFRLGREATPYAEAEGQKLQAKQNEQMRLLDNERQDLISQANQAYTSGKFQLAKQLIEESDKAFERKNQLRREQRDEESAQIDRDIKQANLQMKEQEFFIKMEDRQMEMEQGTAENLATGLIELDDEFNIIEPSNEKLQSISQETGIGFASLLGSVNRRIDEMKKISREERGFALDTRKDEARIALDEFNLQKNKTLLGYDIQYKALDFQDKSLSIEEKMTNILNLQNKMRENRVTPQATLTEKEIDIFDKLPETEKLRKMQSLKFASDNYKTLIEKYGAAGTFSFQQRSDLNAAYANLKTSYTAAKGLGALTGPDLVVIGEAFPDVTGFGKGIFGVGRRAIKTLDRSIQALDGEANDYIDIINARNPAFSNDPYTRSVYKAFMDNKEKPFYADYQDFLHNAKTSQELIDFQEKLFDAEIEEGSQEAEEAWFLDQGLVFNMPLGTGEKGQQQQMGSLSQKYESGGNAGAVGYDKTGGWSYGLYQLAHGKVKQFIGSMPQYKPFFQGLEIGTKLFNAKWKQVSNERPEEFAEAQHNFIQKTHFEPQVKKLASAGYDIDQFSPVLKDVIWSTAVQHGSNTDVIQKAIKRAGMKDEEKLIREIYKERWGGGRRFASSTPSVRNSVYNRYFGKNGEMNLALSQLT